MRIDQGHHQAVDQLLSLYRALATAPDLAPDPVVDDLFSRLVRLVLELPARSADEILLDPRIGEITPHLRLLCATGETQLERSWSRRVRRSPRPEAELELFPYLDNYRRLTELEAAAVHDIVPGPVRRLTFVGSGPLPLSSLFLAEIFGARIRSLDRDAGAVADAVELFRALGRPELPVLRGDVLEEAFAGEDVVMLAALVGASTAEKSRALLRIAASADPGTVVLIRSARAPRTLLYPEVELDAVVEAGLEVLRLIHPDDDVINSVIVARVSGGQR